MCLSIHFKRELLYSIYFLPLCVLKLVFNYYYKNRKNKIFLSTESFSKFSLIIFYIYQRNSNKTTNNNIHSPRITLKQIILIIVCIIFFLISIYLENFNLENIHFDTLSIILIDVIFFKIQKYSHHLSHFFEYYFFFNNDF